MTRVLILTVVAATLVAADSKTFTGVISDSMCVRDHAHMKAGPDADCTRACARAQHKYVLLDGKNSYLLSDQETPAKFAAQKVKVTGMLYEKTGIIKVERIEAVR